MKSIVRVMTALTLFIVIVSVTANAQAIRRVSGKVTDTQSREPIEGVKVTAFMANQPNTVFDATTDKNGKYIITGLTPGQAVFRFEKEGYEPFQTSTRLSSTADRITFNAELVKIKREEGTANTEISEKYNLGVQLFKEGKLDEALGIFEQLLKDYPDLNEVHINIGIILQSKKDYEGALNHFNIALAANPKNETILIYIAEVYLAQQNFEEALKWYIKAAEVKPDFYYVINQIADVARFLEKYDLAEEYYRKSIALDSTQPMPYLYLGTILNLRDDYAESIDQLIKYIEVDPNGPAVPNAKAMIDNMSEKWDGTIDHLRALVAADESRALAQLYLGKVLAFKAMNDEAKVHLNRYLELDAANKYGEREKAEEILSAL
jgi:tetratricopeptide (TPR) repeat protein